MKAPARFADRGCFLASYDDVHFPACGVCGRLVEELQPRGRDMTTKRIRYRYQQMQALRAKIAWHGTVIRRLQSACGHAWKIESHHPKFFDDREPPIWWIHIRCRDCTKSYTGMIDTPLCALCHKRMLVADDDPRADATREAAKAKDKHATRVYVFWCPTCAKVEGFPARIDGNKK